MASSADRVERRAVQQRQSLIPSPTRWKTTHRALSDLARLYVIKPSPETLTQYQQLQQTDKSIEQRLGGLKDNGASREELALLQDGLRIADELQDEQQAAWRMSLAAMRQRPSRCCTAPRTRLNWSACRRRSIASARCLSIAPPSLSTEATERSRIWRTLSEIMVGLTALMFCSSSASFSNAGCSTRWFA